MVAILQPKWPSRCCPILAMQKSDIVVEAPAQQNIQWKSSSDVMKADSKFLVGTYARNPVVLVKGNGCRVSDIEGKEYLDMTAGIAVNALGHNHPDLVRAITEQASTLMHVSNVYYSVPQVELAQRLVDSSFADRVFFTNSGTEANEAAIKFSRKYHQNNGSSSVTDFVAFNKCFHGRTMGALALTSKEAYRTPFEPVMPGVHFVEFGDIKATKDTLKLGKTAAVFLEPVQGEGGVYSTTAKFCKELRELCDDYGALLVFDEVQCGLGRTGTLWAHETYAVHPDIMTLAKPLAGGLPIGAVLVTNAVAAAINTGDHGSTFAGSPLVCKAALAVLDHLQKPGFLESVVWKGNYFSDLLKTKLVDNSHVKEIRAAGLLIGIQLDTAAAPLVRAAQNAGLLVLTAGKGDVVRLAPPLIISEAEIKECVHILEDCLSVLDVKS